MRNMSPSRRPAHSTIPSASCCPAARSVRSVQAITLRETMSRVIFAKSSIGWDIRVLHADAHLNLRARVLDAETEEQRDQMRECALAASPVQQPRGTGMRRVFMVLTRATDADERHVVLVVRDE